MRSPVDDGVRVHDVPRPGQSIRRRGEDVRAADACCRPASDCRRKRSGLAASVGLATLPVGSRPRVALFLHRRRTGDAGRAAEAGRDLQLQPLHAARPAANAGRRLRPTYGIVPDKLDATRATLKRAAERNDLIITCGGVSVGEEDHIKPAVEAEGA